MTRIGKERPCRKASCQERQRGAAEALSIGDGGKTRGDSQKVWREQEPLGSSPNTNGQTWGV
jgi:hypothetical protein